MERVTHYFAANGIAEDKQKDTFLCCIGRDTFSLLRALVAPNKPGDKNIQGAKRRSNGTPGTKTPRNSRALQLS